MQPIVPEREEGPATERREPAPLSLKEGIAYLIGSPAVLGLLLFAPAGTIYWTEAWLFLLVLLIGFTIAALILWRTNPLIFRARSRIQRGTKPWDKRLLALLFPVMALILPVAALDSGRFQWSAVPNWVIALGYVLLLAGLAITTWAQSVNPFFEPGVRIQSERGHRVIDHGPYAIVRHPGYIAALMLFASMALSLGSYWALIPAFAASALLILRTVWEDRMLRTELPGYASYASRVRWRLVPGLW